MNINKLNRKISKITLLVLFIILSTTSFCKVHALPVTEEMLVNSNDMYCSEQGVALAYQNPEYSNDWNTVSQFGTNWTGVDNGTYSSYKGNEYKTVKRENSDFSQVGESYTNPVEAWVLIYGNGYGGQGGTSPWQHKWWTTPAGHGHTHTTTGDRDVNQQYAYSTEMFNAENRAVAVHGVSLLNDFIQVEENATSNIEIAGRAANFSANGNSSGGSVSEADQFADYVKDMTGSKDSICGPNGFNFTKKFDWISEDKDDNGKRIPYSNPTVAKDGNKFIVGPFAIDYVNRGKFSYIKDMQLEIRKDDGSTQTLTIDADKAEFKLNKESNGKFPKPNETFYIVFEGIKNATSIKKIKVNFEYMNATAKYSLWDGSISITDVLLRGKRRARKDSNGNYILDSNGNKTYNYYLKRKETVSVQNAQTVARKEGECKTWYEHTQIERGINIIESNINIIKKIVTSDGSTEIDYNSLPKDNASRSFDFELEVKGAVTNSNFENTERITVMAGSGFSTQSRVYYWLNNGNNAPEFTLKEIKKDGYEISGIKNIKTNEQLVFENGAYKGYLTNDTSLNLEVTNKSEAHKGNIKIKKEIDKNLTDEVKKYFDHKTFNVKVTITPAASGFFVYNGEYYGNNELQDKPIKKTLEIIVPVEVLYDDIKKEAHGEAKLPADIEWYGAEAPTYKVEEILTDEQKIDIETLKINFAEGKLVEYKAGNSEPLVSVTVTNTAKEHKAKVHIIKTVEITNDYSDDLKAKLIEKIKDQKYEFDIKVEGFNVEHAVIDKAIRKDNRYIWEYTSSEYKWQGKADEGPKYTITEVNAPNSQDSNGFKTVCEPGETTGNLVENVQNDYKVDNNILNKITIQENIGKIELIKKVEELDIPEEGEDYTFDIVLNSGLFTYQGKIYEPTEKEPVRLINDKSITTETDKHIIIHVDTNNVSTSFNSEDFTWYQYGDKLVEAPHYEVHEIDVPTNVKNVEIQPKEGVIGTGTVTITAINSGFEAKKGKIHLIKELENANRYDESIINNYKFKFRVYIDRNADNNWDDAEKFERELSPKKIENDNKFIWEWESEVINWKENEPAPKYKIEEIDIPSGIEFKEGTHDDNDETFTVDVNGKYVEGTVQELKEADINFDFKTNNPKMINTIKEDQHGKLAIEKKIETGSEILNGKEFEFEVTVEGTFKYNGTAYNKQKLTFTQKVKGGETWQSDEFTWSSIAVPKYTVVEKEGQEYECISMQNNTGYLINNDTVTATFTNKAKKTESAYLKVIKQLEVGQNSDKKFTFDITIDGKTTTVELKAGEPYISDSYTWNKGENAPTYTVTERADDTSEFIDITADKEATIEGRTISGSLVEGNTVTVTAKNKIIEKHGKFKVKKQIVADEKYVAGIKDKEFKITVTITGNFMIDGEIKDSADFTFPLKANGTWTSPEITWYGDNAPIVSVKEDITGDEYKGWKNIGISNNDVAISDGLEIVVTNEYQIITRLDLTVELAGDVWEDKGKDEKSKEAEPNGIIDNGEIGIDGVEVYVYKSGTNELATVYKDGLNAIQNQPIITSNNGHWDAPRVNLSDIEDQFEVRFVYDGQTYESTKLLASSSKEENQAKIDEFMGTIRKSDRNKYAKDSMAVDTDRSDVNSRISEIYGSTPIDVNGNTTGKIKGTKGEYNVYYTSNVTELGDQTRVISKLKTTNDNGVALDLFKATASTGRLVFPFGTGFEDKFHLSGSDTNITDYGTEIVYHYSATYDYTKHINLGLKKRPESDVEIQKDLVSAKVIVNDRLTNYTFNKLSDIGKDKYDRTYEDNRNLNYTLGLYKTDYYYRAEIYRANMTKDEFDTVENYYKTIDPVNGIDSTELEVYLNYRIGLRNSSSSVYNVKINEIEDYYDSTFKLIDKETKRHVKSIDENGNIQESDVVVAKAPYLEKGGSFNSNVDFSIKENGIKGSDGVTYNKLSARLNGVDLKSGEVAYVYASFQVEKGTFKGVQDAIALGGKSNLAEISNYSTYYANGGNIAGKIDRDSAPANINVINHNSKNWYEDDADIAPVLNLKINENDRTVSGLAWEDKAIDNKSVGDGIYDAQHEALIGGLTTELVEKVTAKNSEGKYVDYDFVWPTNARLDSLGGMTMEELTGFDSIIETSREKDSLGQYTFTGAPTGNYVVRFVYGDNKANLNTTMGMTGNAEAYDKDGKKLNEFNTSNYMPDVNENSVKVYNGQDFKSTIYQGGKADINNEWHNLNNTELNDENKRVSDARDSEARRLEVIANSETITNSNGSVLATANDIDMSHTELFNDYYMFADTAKLNIAIENLSVAAAVKGIQEVDSIITDYGSVIIDENKFKYEVPTIDFGLIERPKNKLVLDKEISSIKITTNDGNVIFDAEYNISYDLKDKNAFTDLFNNENKILAKTSHDGKEKYLVAKVELNKDASKGIEVLQALDKKENKVENTGVQNFRFINVDESILQGATIEINYKLTAINVGEDDYTSSKLADITGTSSEIRNSILEKAEDAQKESIEYSSNSNKPETGKYLGKFYYTGEQGSDDRIVTTKVRQVAEYIDNDGVFSTDNNNTENHSWKATSTRELEGNGYDKNRIVQSNITILGSVYDKNERLYIKDSNNNVALSIDTDADTTMSNKEFEKNLVPADLNEDDAEKALMNSKSEINITITKSVSAEEDADNLTFDNIAEIVKIENSVGRRDITVTPGNSNPKGSKNEESSMGEFASGLKERDSSATELVTFTPPTGIETQNVMTSQILIIIVVALGIVAVGIVTIKKKVLTK